MKLKMIVNLFGGPCVGKSVIASELFVAMKKENYNVELVNEYAKELTYEERFNILDQDQLYIFAKQHRKILRLKDKVDFIITDSPLLLSIVYAGLNLNNIFDEKTFKDLVVNINNKYNNLNVLLKRNSTYRYKKEGRYQDEKEAIIVDGIVRETILPMCTSHIELLSDDITTETIMNYIRTLTI